MCLSRLLSSIFSVHFSLRDFSCAIFVLKTVWLGLTWMKFIVERVKIGFLTRCEFICLFRFAKKFTSFCTALWENWITFFKRAFPWDNEQIEDGVESKAAYGWQIAWAFDAEHTICCRHKSPASFSVSMFGEVRWIESWKKRKPIAMSNDQSIVGIASICGQKKEMKWNWLWLVCKCGKLLFGVLMVFEG